MMHDDLGFPGEHDSLFHRSVDGTTLKRGREGAHTTISSNGLQNELVIGRVGILGNLGKGKSTNGLGSTPKGDLLSEAWLSRAKGRGTQARRHQTRISEPGYNPWMWRKEWWGYKLSKDAPGRIRNRPVHRKWWGRKMNCESLTSPLNFWTASAYGSPAILAESVSKYMASDCNEAS